MAIKVEHVGKRYRIGEGVPKYKSLRESISKTATSLMRRVLPFGRGVSAARENNHVWSLHDVSFSVDNGEILGVVGRNGAGKSTLLKLLSRITEPTTGKITIEGRVGSLLEVGTGFHPELTGRENIYLNGAILGMQKSQILKQFDEIVSFSGVEKFIDTAVKHYSSGMYLRLAFAVAAHMDTDILLIDEVLAVGDAAFQNKCLGKMSEVVTTGRTVLFVSHNLALVRDVCTKTLLLDSGKVKYVGPTGYALQEYGKLMASNEKDDRNYWKTIGIESRPLGAMVTLMPGEDFVAVGELHLPEAVVGGRLIFLIEDSMSRLYIYNIKHINTKQMPALKAGVNTIRVSVKHFWPIHGAYSMLFDLHGVESGGKQVRHVSERVFIDVAPTEGKHTKSLLGVPCDWELGDGSKPLR